MFKSGELGDELLALKSEMSRLLSLPADEAVQNEARTLQSQFTGMVHQPLNSALPLVLVPLVTIILRSLKKSRAPAPAAKATAEPS